MADEDENDGVTVFPPGVFLAGLILGFALWWFWPAPVAPAGLNLAVRVFGVIVIVLGFAVMAWALRLFQKVGTTPTHWEPTTALAVDGPYRFTRNPMYVGMALVQGGIALLGNALWPLVALVPVLWIIQTQVVAREEAYLERRFAGAYREFKGRVHRWL